MDSYQGGQFNQQPETVWCPECGQVVPLKMLAVHRNRMHSVPMPETPPRKEGAPDSSVPMWVSDKELPPKKPEPAPPLPEAQDSDDTAAVDTTPETDEIPPHEHEMPEHAHEEYKGLIDKNSNDLTTLKLAIANLVDKLQKKDTEIAELQGMLDKVAKPEEENIMATATPIVLYDPDEKKVVATHLLYKKSGISPEGLLRALADAWQKDGKGVDVLGLPPRMSLRVKEDSSGRGFDLVPGSILVARVSKKDREAIAALLRQVEENTAATQPPKAS